jgi:hypothetical protein
MSITNFKRLDSANGVPVSPSYVNVNTPTIVDDEYVISSSDIGDLILLNSINTITVSLPTDSVVIPVGSTISLVQWGAGTVNILPDSGVVIRQEPGVTVDSTDILRTRSRYSRVELVKIGQNEWLSDGYGIYVQSTAPANPQVDDLWFW